MLPLDKSGRFLKNKLGIFGAILSSVKTTKIPILGPNFRYKKIDHKKKPLSHQITSKFMVFIY